MNQIHYFILFILLFSTSFSQVENFNKQSELSKGFIEKFKSQEFDGIYAMFDSTVQSKLPIVTLQQIYSQIQAQSGDIENILNQNCSIKGEYILCVNTVKLSKGNLKFLLSFNKNNQISGFFIQPDDEKVNYTNPSYADTTKFQKKSLKFGTEFPLDGELDLPIGQKPVPCIIFVHGSGPNDMDETILSNKPFKDLAYGLSSNGIATFRYNKRTYQYGAQLTKYIDTLTLDFETLEDVQLAYNYVKNQAGIDSKNIYILGHSLGGYAIPKIAEMIPEAAGFIMLAGSARPLEEVISDQFQYLSELPNPNITPEQLDEAKQLIEKIKKEDFSEVKSPSDYPFAASPAYWKYLHRYDPLKSASKIKRPILVLQGERDYQVSQKDFELWKSALKNNKDAEFKLYPNVNHLFLEGTGKSTPDEYNTIGHIPIYVINDIVNWVNKSK